MRALLAEREPSYRLADVAVDTSAGTPREVADRIVDLIERRIRGRDDGAAMRYLILSDIHANCEALTAVLAHVRRKRWDKAVVLGRPRRLRRQPEPGRRDGPRAQAAGGDPRQPRQGLLRASRTARCSTGWRCRRPCGRDSGSPRRTCAGCSRCPRARSIVDGAFAIAHGTPIDEDAYIFGEIEALNVFRQTAFPLCFFGHSHFPVIFGLSPDAIQTVLTDGALVPLPARAGGALPRQPGLDRPAARRQPARVVRDVRQRHARGHGLPGALPRSSARSSKILDAGLPRPLADRLALGR